MILKYSLLGNLLLLWMNIVNLVVMVRLYYGFLTTFSMGPSYLLLLRTRFIVFISTYYPPLHLALSRPHTLTVLVIPYLLFHFLFFWNNKKSLFDYRSTHRNFIPNLIDIFMFRYKNKILFLTSSFFGWLIGHINSVSQIFSIILFIICICYLGRMPSPLITKKLKESAKGEEKKKIEEEGNVEIEIVSKTNKIEQEADGSVEEDLSISLEEEERWNLYKNIYEAEEIWLNGKEKDEFDLKEKEKNELLWIEKSLLSLLFNYQRWNRPLRYIENDRFSNAVRNEMSQYFFYTCTSDGKQRISFTYPPSLSTFFEMIQKKMSFRTIEKLPAEALSNEWVSTTKKRRNNLRNEFINRIEAIDKGSLIFDVVEKRARLCNDEEEQECLPKNDSTTSTRGSTKMAWINKIYGILFSKDYREFERELEHEIDKLDVKSSSTGIEDSSVSIGEFTEEAEEAEKSRTQKVFDMVRADPNDKKISNLKIEEIKKKVPRWLYKLTSDLDFEEEEEEEEEDDQEESTDDHGIRSRRAKYVVIYTETDTDQDTNIINTTTDNIINTTDNIINTTDNIINTIDTTDNIINTTDNIINTTDNIINTTDNIINTTDNIINTNDNIINTTNQEKNSDDQVKNSNQEKNGDRRGNGDQAEEHEIALIRYSQQSDFCCDLIKGSMRAQRCKTVTWEIIEKTPLFSFDISRMMNLIFRNWIEEKSPKIKIYDYVGEGAKEKEKIDEEHEEEKGEYKRKEDKRQEEERIAIAEAWDNIILAQVIKSSILVTHSILRKYIVLPSLIIVKNIGRMLLFQFPEWYEDFNEWSREMHVKCTYNGDWLTDGIQIKILFPFSLKPWHRKKLRSHHKDLRKKQKNFCFLTVWGMETELPFGSPRKKPFFKGFFFLIILKDNIKGFLKILNEKIRRIIKIILFIKIKVNELLFFFRVTRVSDPSQNEEPSQNEKDSKISNRIIHESPIRIVFGDWTNDSLIERKINDLADKKTKIWDQDIDISTNKGNFSNKRTESQKHIGQISKKRRSARLISKWDSFMKSFIERIYMGILLCITNIYRINVQFFLDSAKKTLNGYTYNDKIKEKDTNETNPNIIPFISTVRSLFTYTTNISSDSNSPIYCELSSLSQAYVFYKLFQTQLKSHYQYNLSHDKWSRLAPLKWRKKVNQHRTIKNNDSPKLGSYEEKDQLIHSGKKDYDKLGLLKSPSCEKKIKKHYKYDLLSYKYLNHEDISNYNTHKYKSFYAITINDSLEDKYTIDRDQNLDRKYFELRITNFYPRNNMETRTSTGIRTFINKKKKTTKTGTNKKDILSLYIRIHQEIQTKQKEFFFDWMGMNEQMLDRTISNLCPWFLPEFVPLYDRYKTNPWITPIKLFLFDFHGNKTSDLYIDPKVESNKKERFNPKPKKQKKDVGANSAGSDIKKRRKKKKLKSKKEAELDFFLKKYFLFQLRWDDSFNQRMTNNIKVYCLLLTLMNPNEIAIFSIQRGEMGLNVMLINKDLSLPELIKRGIFFIEPVCLSIKWDGISIMYQTIAISLTHKVQHQTNRGYEVKKHIDKNYFNGSIARHGGVRVNGDNNNYDLLVPEHILSPSHRRELRIISHFNYQNRNLVNKNPVFYNRAKTNAQGFDKFKVFFWPTHRLEDLACMNRYWFDTNNGSRFSMSRIHMYQQFGIR
ncbi:unnamed protein product [Victoria cruziana]